MKARVYIIIICLFVATLSAYADMTQSNKSFGQTDYDEMSSNRAVMNSQRYSSPIFEPFTNTTPSEQSEIGSNSPKPSGNMRKFGNFDDVPEGGTQDESYPIGDTLFPLLALALAFGGITYLRRRSVLKR